MNDHPPAPPRDPERRRRWLGSVLALLMLLAVAALAWHLTHTTTGRMGPAGPNGRGRGGPPVTVGLATAERADVPEWLEALGTVTPTSTVTVRPQVTGVLTQVLYREGEMVRKGQLLATIDPAPFRLALQQAIGQRQRDEAQLENARLTLKRYQTLLAQDSIARQDVDTQAALVHQFEGAVTADAGNEGSARLNLSNTRITAPVAGRTGLRPVDAGNLVASGDANGVAVITQVTPIDVSFAIPQDRVPDIQARTSRGARLPVTALDRSRTAVLDDGDFITLDNQIDTQTGTVRAKARFANNKGTLFPNQFVNVRLLIDTVRQAVTVPVTAVREGPDGDYVFVLNSDRTVAQRPVQRGLVTAERVVIRSGLQPGERVVTEGADRLRDGARVMLPGDSAPGGAAATGPRSLAGPAGGRSSGRAAYGAGGHGRAASVPPGR